MNRHNISINSLLSRKGLLNYSNLLSINYFIGDLNILKRGVVIYSNVYRVIFFVLTICLINCSNLYSIADSYKIIYPNGKQMNMPSVRVNDYDYISLRNFAKYIFADSKYIFSTGEIIDKEIRLRCLPASFFVLYQNNEEIKISQMTLPAINLREEIFVPVNTFFQSLNSLGCIKNKVEGKSIYLESIVNLMDEDEKKDEFKNRIDYKVLKPGKETLFEIDTETTQTKQNNLKKTDTFSIQKSSIKTENGNKPENKIRPSESKDSQPPTQFFIPKNLHRNEIDNIKNNLKKGDSSKTDLMNIHFEDFLKNQWKTINENGSNNIFDKNLIAALMKISAQEAAMIIEVSVENNENQTDIHLKADGIIKTYQKPEINGKELIIRLPGIENGVSDLFKKTKDCPVTSIKYEQIGNNLIYRVKFNTHIDDYSTKRKLQNEIIYSVKFKNKTDNDKLNKNFEKTGEIKESKIKNPSDNSTDKTISQDKKKWDLDVIVIDPGHGGEDPGAISLHNYKEKDIALKIGKKLKKLIQQKLPDTKVVMTRNDDTFIELYKRGQIANKAKGKLFISIHLNSMPQKPCKTNGYESYILRPGRNDDAIRVANKENSSIKFEKDQSKYKKLTEEELIIATMAQSAFVKLSEKFAAVLQEEIGKITGLEDRGINQAGFYVLVGASMPNLLFEGGFLSNEKDEKFLISDKGQEKIAKGIINAIKRYAKEYRCLVNGNNK